MKVVKAAVLGLGTVNQNLLQILEKKKDCLARDYGVAFSIVAATDSSGIVVNQDGFDATALVAHKQGGKRLSNLSSCFRGSDAQKILKDLDVHLLWEATPCDRGSDSEALNICRDALNRGVAVVLANKGPLVAAMRELRALAKGRLEYSATVCGGLPVLNIGRRDMIAGRITKLEGVFNATTNFILQAMAHGDSSFDEAVREAQRVGAAEADPSLDTGGWDTAFKLLIIANTIMGGVNITMKDITVQGIEGITVEQIRSAEEERGETIKLVATATDDGTFEVRPMAKPKDGFLGSITGWEMGVAIHSDIYGISYHKLYEKEPIPTAASMMRDAVHIFSDGDY